jgi:hypothetical protein
LIHDGSHARRILRIQRVVIDPDREIRLVAPAPAVGVDETDRPAVYGELDFRMVDRLAPSVEAEGAKLLVAGANAPRSQLAGADEPRTFQRSETPKSESATPTIAKRIETIMG